MIQQRRRIFLIAIIFLLHAIYGSMCAEENLAYHYRGFQTDSLSAPQANDNSTTTDTTLIPTTAAASTNTSTKTTTNTQTTAEASTTTPTTTTPTTTTPTTTTPTTTTPTTTPTTTTNETSTTPSTTTTSTEQPAETTATTTTTETVTTTATTETLTTTSTTTETPTTTSTTTTSTQTPTATSTTTTTTTTETPTTTNTATSTPTEEATTSTTAVQTSTAVPGTTVQPITSTTATPVQPTSSAAPTTTTVSNSSGDSGTPWYAIVIPVLVLVLLVGFGIFVAVRYRHKIKLLLQRVRKDSVVSLDKRPFSQSYSKPIKVADFEEVSASLQKDSCFKLQAEYEEIENISPKLPQTLDALAADNAYKNRFTDILPFDENRVRLNQNVSTPVPSTSQALPDLIPTSDYINASLIEGFHNRYEYIVAMGPIGEDEVKQNTSRRPKIATVQDFLELIMQQDVQVIIMMTMPLEEHNLVKKVKCAQYWPNDADETVDFGKHSVTLITEEYLSDDYDVRLLRITKGPHKHLARHFLYKDMKDYGVTHEDKMLEFVRSVRKFVDNDSPLKPLLVHCSAGVGRSGTFIAIDQLLQQLDQNAKVLDVFKTVYNLRKQRVRMVQNQDQYRLIYQSVSLAVHRKLNPDPTTIATENEYENDNVSEPVYENVVKRQSVPPEQDRIRQLNREVSATNLPMVRLSQLSSQTNSNGNGQTQSTNGDRVSVKIEPEPKREPSVASAIEF